MPTLAFIHRSALLGVGCIFVLYLAAVKLAVVPVYPGALAVAAGIFLVLAAVEAGRNIWQLRRPPRDWLLFGSRGAIWIGLLAVAGAGLGNWLYSLQGYVVLTEGEAVPLFRGSHLQMFEGGPLADPAELEPILRLHKLDIVPGTNRRPSPDALVEFTAPDGTTQFAHVTPTAVGEYGSLRFYPGAFGYAPRIVVLQGEEQLLDQVVPFTTRRPSAEGYSFSQVFTIAAAKLEVHGTLDLSSLDDQMRGHPTLHLRLMRDGHLLGAGQLMPGRFAELDHDFRVGFAGMKKWVELDLARRNYPEPMIGGFLVALLGVLTLGLRRIWQR